MSAPDVQEGAERDYAREVAGTAESVIWELDQPDPDWPAVRELAEKLLRTALQAPVPGSEERPDSAPVADAGIDDVRYLVLQAPAQISALEREVRREPCDLPAALEATRGLCDTAGQILLILRSLSGEGER